MGAYSDKGNIEKRVNKSRAGGGGGGLPPGEYDVKLIGACIRMSDTSNQPGFSFQLRVSSSDKNLDRKEIRLEFWHSVGFNIDNFLNFMAALGFDFDLIPAWEKEHGKEWTHDTWIDEKIFEELEEKNVKFKITAKPQKRDKSRMDYRPIMETVPKVWEGKEIEMDEATAAAVKRRQEQEAKDEKKSNDPERDV